LYYQDEQRNNSAKGSTRERKKVWKMISTYERFEAFNDDYLKFDRIENKRNQRPDLHAWLLLDELFPHPGHGIVSAAESGEIWIDVEGEKLEILTDEQILELVRCGVWYDSEYDCLAMFA
jgi:hypothetical protein